MLDRKKSTKERTAAELLKELKELEAEIKRAVRRLAGED